MATPIIVIRLDGAEWGNISYPRASEWSTQYALQEGTQGAPLPQWVILAHFSTTAPCYPVPKMRHLSLEAR